jgi:hypothetical protein
MPADRKTATFDYGVPAELFMGKRTGGPRQPLRLSLNFLSAHEIAKFSSLLAVNRAYIRVRPVQRGTDGPYTPFIVRWTNSEKTLKQKRSCPTAEQKCASTIADKKPQGKVAHVPGVSLGRIHSNPIKVQPRELIKRRLEASALGS